MLTLDRAVARNVNAGEALRFQWQLLRDTATPRRGQLCMVYGPSGSCKSMFALNSVLDWQLPTLYISPDTDQHDMATRVVCRRNGLSSTAVEQGLAIGAFDLKDELADTHDWLRFSFDPSPTVDDLDLELMAFTEQFGAPPSVLVVDTLSDVEIGDEDEYRGYRRTMKALHHIVRSTNAFGMVVHHSTGEHDGDTSPSPRRGINGKLSKVPELILSVARNDTHFGTAIVKQRGGESDPQAHTVYWLSVDPARASITDRITY